MTLKQATEVFMRERRSAAVGISNGLKKEATWNKDGTVKGLPKISCRPKVIFGLLAESCDALVKRCESTGPKEKDTWPDKGEHVRIPVYAVLLHQKTWLNSAEEREVVGETALEMIKCEKQIARVAARLHVALQRRKGKRRVLLEGLNPVFESIREEINARDKKKLARTQPKASRHGRQKTGSEDEEGRSWRKEDGHEGRSEEDDPLYILERIENAKENRKRLIKMVGDEEKLNRLLARLISAVADGNEAVETEISKGIRELNITIVKEQEALDASGTEGTAKTKN